MSQQTDEPTTTDEFWWGNSPTAPPLPEIPVARFKVGDVVPNWYMTPHTILGVRLELSSHQDYETGWDGTPMWEYNLWRWVKNRYGNYSYEEWGWCKEAELLKDWERFQENLQEKACTSQS